MIIDKICLKWYNDMTKQDIYGDFGYGSPDNKF